MMDFACAPTVQTGASCGMGVHIKDQASISPPIQHNS